MTDILAERTNGRVGTASLAIIVVVSLFCLHLLRNVSPIYPAAAWLVALAAIPLSIKTRRVDRLGLVVAGLLCASIAYSVVISFVKFPHESYVVPIGRYVFMAPFAIFVALVVTTARRVDLALKTFAVWVAIAGGTVIWQTMFGPIHWFAEPSVRDGAVRYASLAGSLTAIGVVGGMALPLAFLLFKSTVVRAVLTGVLTASLLMSLQKAAILNMVIFWAGLIAMFGYAAMVARSFKPGRSTALAIIGMVLVVLAVAMPGLLFSRASSPLFTMTATVNNVVRTNPGQTHDDIDVSDGIYGRLITLPQILFKHYGTANMLTGVGLVGGSGSTGFDQLDCADASKPATCVPRYPMAHNAVVELLAMGGLPLALSFLAAIALVVFRLIRLFVSSGQPTRTTIAVCLCMVIAVLNMPATSGILSQPYLAAGLFLIGIPILIWRRDS